MTAYDWIFLVVMIGLVLLLTRVKAELREVNAELEREWLKDVLRGGEELTRIKETVGFIAEELAQLARTDAETEVGA